MKQCKGEKGQAGLEFVIIVPVLLFALFLLAIIGNQLYQKLSAQTFAYSHCIWEVVDIDVFPDPGSAFDLVVDETKRTWSTEGLWESYPTTESKVITFESLEETFIKKCVGSVTHDEWSEVGSGYFSGYNPDVLVESKLSIQRSYYRNTDRAVLPPLVMRRVEPWSSGE